MGCYGGIEAMFLQLHLQARRSTCESSKGWLRCAREIREDGQEREGKWYRSRRLRGTFLLVAGKTDENVAIEVFLGSLRSLAVLVRKSQPRFVRRIFFVERRAMSRSAPLRRTRAIDDNHRRYATRAYIRTWNTHWTNTRIHTHAHNYRQTVYTNTTAVAYITWRDTRECECTQVVRCYRAAASWCFYSLDTRHIHARARACTYIYTQTHRHGHTLSRRRTEFARIARSVRRSGSSRRVSYRRKRDTM